MQFQSKDSLLFSFMLHDFHRAAANKGIIKASREMMQVSILILVPHSELGFSTIKKGNSNHGYLVLKCDSLHSGDFYFLNSTFFVFVSIVIEKILENKHTIFHVVWFIIRGKT